MGRAHVVGMAITLAAAPACGDVGAPAATTAVPADPVPYVDDAQPDAPEYVGNEPRFNPVEVSLEAVPERVAIGDTARFVVVLRNPTATGIPLRPCPTFFMSYGESGTAVFHKGRLNCDDAPPAIPAHGAVRFEMKLTITTLQYLHPGFVGQFFWRLTSATEPPFAVSGPVTAA